MVIEPEHFRYLVIQRGEVSDQRHDPKVWKQAYEKSLMDIFSSIHPVLPPVCESVLDIASGLGGINIVLLQHYGRLKVTLLDGLNCPADVQWHHKPFSNAKVAKSFHAANGSREVDCVFPEPEKDRKYDLITSYAGYCFHIPPADYLDVVLRARRSKDTICIFDVRRERPQWLLELAGALGKPVVLKSEKKYVRLAFGCEQSSSSVEDGQ
jgi:hypothetical protein